MNKNLLTTFIFILVLMGILAILPVTKTEGIGDFFEKIITPISYPLSAFILWRTGIVHYKNFKGKDPH